jgi:hypothetical protein
LSAVVLLAELERIKGHIIEPARARFFLASIGESISLTWADKEARRASQAWFDRGKLDKALCLESLLTGL